LFSKYFSDKWQTFFGGRTNPSAGKIKRSKHALSRKQLSKNAVKVLYRLSKSGYQAYLVGGGVRDVLLQRSSKDYDVATDATPEQIRKCFVNSRIIGRRFRLVHVYFHGEIIEVSTFRAAADQADEAELQMIRSDNTFGSLEDDVWRRDFTVNALYYNIADFSILDLVGGMADLKRRKLRMIGDPVQRFHEDPIRLLRAIRFAAKLNFKMEPQLDQAVRELPHLLSEVPGSRLLHEFEKLYFSGYAAVTFKVMEQYGYLKVTVPGLASCLQQDQSRVGRQLIDLALEATDCRYADKQSLNPGFLLAVMMWPVFQLKLASAQQQDERFFRAVHQAMQQTVIEQSRSISIPKRYVNIIHSVWLLQYYFINRRPKRIYFVLQHRYFRAAIDLMELRVAAGESGLAEIAKWWRGLSTAKRSAQEKVIKAWREDYIAAKNREQKSQ
jgi:poly(A) polymerase